ncbi:deoxyuridinetriphosphatasehypothetical protein bacterial origin [Cryptosporidium ryanae]|uniref:deoxyuridinetriphosphatasehypothetical protein bacterial origin n=1 Tax=Cryptosporidium ryanae TaxID=515981 RepID=UPI00351A65AD|nr:deoxyuridinetriphosphatasehypothetical protein bacterial origin [Cryptosporidium ryanae]
MRLSLLPLNSVSEEFYKDHKTFHDGDSGLDLFIVEDQTIKAGDTAFIKLGFKAAAYSIDGDKPLSYLLLPRSSISKSPLRLSNSVGLIDAGYRGELMASVDNIKNFDFEVKKGERYFQLVAFNGEKITLNVVSELDEKTSRGKSGFGSTNDLKNNPNQSCKIPRIEEETS